MDWKTYTSPPPEYPLRLKQMTTHELIQLRAYQLWEEAGRPDQMADHFWFEAERILDKEGLDLRYCYPMEKGYIFVQSRPNICQNMSWDDVQQMLSDFVLRDVL